MVMYGNWKDVHNLIYKTIIFHMYVVDLNPSYKKTKQKKQTRNRVDLIVFEL